jgi:hypothetical protein
LADYFDASDGPNVSEINLVLGDIGHVIDCLLRFAVAIRNPTPHDQFNSRVGVEVAAAYRPWDINHIREWFVGISDGLVDRFVAAMSRRRQYFKYREDHSNKLANGLDNHHADTVDNTTVASSIPDYLKDIECGSESEINIIAKFHDDVSEASETSYATSHANNNQLRVPHMPKDYIDGPFKCPFCYTIIFIKNRKAWKYTFILSNLTYAELI